MVCKNNATQNKTLQIVTNLLTVLKDVLQKKLILAQMVGKFYTFFYPRLN
jgi:hypothetical protein